MPPVGRLAEECRKYGGGDSAGAGTALGRSAIHFGGAHAAIEKERDNLDRTLGMQVRHAGSVDRTLGMRVRRTNLIGCWQCRLQREGGKGLLGK